MSLSLQVSNWAEKGVEVVHCYDSNMISVCPPKMEPKRGGGWWEVIRPPSLAYVVVTWPEMDWGSGKA